jgi:hypothetical protein
MGPHPGCVADEGSRPQEVRDLRARAARRDLSGALARGGGPPSPYVRGQIRIRRDEEDPLAILPRVHRERLARRCAGLQYTGANPLTALIGADTELTATLLQEGVVCTDMLLGAMLGQRGATLEALGLLLIRDGATPEWIAATGNLDTAYGVPESSVR